MSEVYGVEDCNTCYDTGRITKIMYHYRWTREVLVDLGPCPDCELGK